MLSNILHQPSRVITQQVWENVCDPPIQQACIDCLCCASENMVTTLPSWNISSSGTQKGNQQKSQTLMPKEALKEFLWSSGITGQWLVTMEKQR